MSEGFVIHLYNDTKGHVLKCCFQEDGTEGFYTDITKALAMLDLIREDFGYEYRLPSLRLNTRRK